MPNDPVLKQVQDLSGRHDYELLRFTQQDKKLRQEKCKANAPLPGLNTKHSKLKTARSAFEDSCSIATLALAKNECFIY
jgi:hypothetical protein